MELQALLVLCGVGVVVVAVLLLMGLFSASGTSYEEAIAQQRRATTELLALAENKNKPKKNNKKAIKKARKEKNKENAVTTGSEVDSEAPAESGLDEDTVPPAKPHVEFCPPVVVDVPRDTLPNVKIRKRGKDPKVKPILINKEDPSCISDPSTPPSPTGSVSNHFEEIHPKDEFELLHSSLAAEKTPEKKEEVVEKKEKPAKAAKAGKGKQPAPEPAKEERERHNSGEAPKEQRKGNKKADKKQVEEEVKAEVIPPLNVPQPSELTTDKLLKQAQALAAPAPTAAVAPAPAPAHAPAPAGKNKKKKAEPNVLSLMAGDGGGVNVGELVRVVREAALSRTEIQILTDALLNKHHDPLPQHSEWTEGPNDPMQKLKKQLADKEKVLADEVEASQALHAKLKELRATLNAERGRVTATTRAHEQAAEAARAEIHTHQTRVKRLAEDNHQLQQENRLLQSKLAAEGEFQQQRAQMEMHIQQLSEAEASLVAQLQGLQSELAARALEVAGARCDAGAARDAAIMAQQHAAELAQQLEQLSHDHTRAMQERQAAIADLQNNVQRLMSRAQFAEGNLDKQKEEMDAQVKQLTSELASLREQLAAREAELAEAKQMKVAAPAQNGLPNDQNKSAELAKVESVVEALRSSLSAEQRANKEQKDALTQLQDQLRSYQEKNNELRTKNWKVMEALQTAEKALQAKSANAPAQDPREAVSAASAAAYAEACGALRGALPGAAPSGVAGKAWLLQFADNLKKELQKAASVPAPVPAAAPAPAEARVAELRAHNDHLQALVDKYKKIIDDTEGVLSQLQANVTREEASWARQLAEKQHELDSLRQHTLTQMQKKIDSLQAELQQKQAANHNHSFADSERLTEERLLTAGLSEKYKTDVCNGPLQVGLEEK